MNKLAVALLRQSDPRQQLQGDSLEDQKIQVINKAKTLGITEDEIEFFELVQSGSGAIQPAQQVIDYCKQNKNIKYCFIVRIDRFTRGGHRWYWILKDKLTELEIKLVDTEGRISLNNVNTLEHLNVKYKWSEFNPSENEEMLAAEFAKEKVREQLTRMIGAETRYTRAGYWTAGAPPHGYQSKRVDTVDSKRRLILRPLEEESKYTLLMYEKAAEKRLSPEQICEELNGLGYRSRKGKKLTPKQLDKYLSKPIHCGIKTGIRAGKQEEPIKFVGEPILSIELWNKANEGKWNIFEDDFGKINIARGAVPSYLQTKNIYDDLFPHKQSVACPICKKPFLASTSSNKSGKFYSFYHCSNGHKWFGVRLNTFNTTIESFVKEVKLTDEYIKKLRESYVRQYEALRSTSLGASMVLDKKIAGIKKKQVELSQTIKLIHTPSLIANYEEEYKELENDLKQLQVARNKQEAQKAKIQLAINSFWYYLEHMDELILKPVIPSQSGKLFALLFRERPTYKELTDGTPKLASIFTKKTPKSLSVSRLRVELRTYSLRGNCSNQLS